MSAITLTNTNVNSGTSVILKTPKITYSWKNLIENKPIQNNFGKSEAQFNGWEDPLFNISFIIRPNDTESNTMTWKLWNDFVKQKPTSSNTTTLSISTGGLTSQGVSGSSADFYSYALNVDTAGTKDIPVLIKSFSLNLNAGDSNNGYFWVVNAQLIETK